MIEYIASGVIGCLGGILGAYAASKILFSDDRVLQKIDVVLAELHKNEDWQKTIYSAGVLIGNGAKAGLGIGKTAGKFKFEDLLMHGAASFLEKFFTDKQQQPQQRQWSQ